MTRFGSSEPSIALTALVWGGLPALLHEAMTMKRGNQPDLHPRLFQNLLELVILNIARMREDDDFTEKANGK